MGVRQDTGPEARIPRPNYRRNGVNTVSRGSRHQPDQEPAFAFHAGSVRKLRRRNKARLPLFKAAYEKQTVCFSRGYVVY